MVKHCVVCGAAFNAPPSSKKITCSSECSKARKALTHTDKHNAWSLCARQRLSETRKACCPTLDRARQAALALPESQRGPQNRGAKIWTLIDPDGHELEVVNLLHWARINAGLFDIVNDAADRERVAHNISTGFQQIIRSMCGKRPKSPIYTYKGWGIKSLPESKTKERG